MTTDMTDPKTAPLLEAINICKSFPGVRALRGVSLHVKPGEVLALLGENGAGKSTLMKILAGVQPADEGELKVDGQTVSIRSVQDAMKHGIALIHQELNLADNLDVGANIFLGREPLRFGLIDKAQIRQDSQKYLDAVGLNISPDTIASTLTIGHQQLVEIAKALSVNARLLIMDEPTSSLSHAESVRLFEVIKDLRAKGVSIIYISHRLGEVCELADRVTVLRDGENAGDLQRDQIHHAAMVKLMVGRDVSQFYSRKAHTPGKTVLEVEDLRTPTFPDQSLSFSLKEGEIVGVAGLVGAGRTEMLRSLFGVDQAVSGRVRIEGKDVSIHHCHDAIANGMALVPEDRKAQGVVLGMAITPNIGLPGLSRFKRWMLFRNSAIEQQHTREMMAKLRIKAPGAWQIVRHLSGGNQQKVVLGKWMALSPKILLLDEPTRGIDIGAKQEIYQLMEEFAGQGMAILFVSSEMEEILGMSDRTLVMHEGRLTGELLRQDLSEEAVMHLATGTSTSLPDAKKKRSAENLQRN